MSMTEKEYNEALGVRRSDLWRMHESPEKYLWFLEHPEPDTPALIFGSLAHKALLEPDGLPDEFAVAPSVDRRTNEGKAAWKKAMIKKSSRWTTYRRRLKCRSRQTLSRLSRNFSPER